MDRNKLDAVKEIANLKIEEILDALGVNYKERYNYVVACCPVHGGDRADAFSWHLDRGIWKCFSRECEAEHGSDIIGLIRGIKGYDFHQAIEFLTRFVNVNLSDSEIRNAKDRKDNKNFIDSIKKKDERDRIYSKDCLDKLVKHPYLEERGYPLWIVEKYHIGACLEPDKYMSNRIVIPVVNKNGEIVGFTGRTLCDGWKDLKIPKWKHSLGSWVSHNLFNINFAFKYINESGIAIICEGPFDVLRLEQAGIRNGVAVLGKKFYDSQMSLLINCGATRLFDALDNDAAGKVGSLGILKSATCLFDIQRAEIPSHRKDIGEMTVEEIRKAFNEKVAIWN